nr:autotransporter domain-containing protein [Gammaproteobacteria bacterium]
VISGTGLVTQAGTGTTILTGNNTYSGGTTVAAGTLSLGSNTAAGTGTITTTGSIIDYADGVTISNPININSNTTQLQVTAGKSATQSGVISETGGARPLEKIGDGSLTLSAANTFSGGLTHSAGTLVIANDSALGTGTFTIKDGTTITNSGTVNLNNNFVIDGNFTRSAVGGLGSMNFRGNVDLGAGIREITVLSGSNLQFFGSIGGTGGITIVDTNNRIEYSGTAANTYTGLTTVQNGGGLGLSKSAGVNAIAGNLTIDTGGSVTIATDEQIVDTATVTVNGNLTVNNGVSETIGNLQGNGAIGINSVFLIPTATFGVQSGNFGGVIADRITLNKTTAGTLTLTGANTYTGGTTISAGTLQIGNGGTTGSIAGNITNNGTLAVNRSDDLTFANIVSGTGGLNKLGGNVLTLTGANTYTGATNVNAGTLLVNGSLGNTAVAVNNGGILGGTGTITGGVTVNTGGTLAPGNSPGTLTVGSLTLNTGSTTQFEINGTTPGTGYDQIVVTGNAQLGGTAELSFGFTPSNGDTFTLIDAATITGDFDSVVNSLGNALIFTTSITDDYVLSITAVQTSFATSGFTGDDPDLIAIAMVLDNNFSDPDLLPIINALNSLPGTSLEDALDLINPDELTALSGFSFANTRSAILRLGNRLRALRNGASGIDTSGFSLFDQSGQFRSKSLLADTSTVAPTGLQIMEPAVQHDPRLGVFISGSGTFGDYDGDANGAGYDYDAAAVLGGADYRISDTAAVGFYAGYDRTDLNLGNNGGTVDADTARFGATGTWWAPQTLSEKHDLDGTTYVEAHAGGAHHWYQTDRNGFGGVASGDTTAVEFSTGGTLGYEFRKGNFTFGPEASLNYMHLWTDGFTETGSLAPLTTNNNTSGSLYSTVGGRMAYQLEIQGLQISPFAHAGWRHEYLGTTGSIAARFANGAGGVFNVSGSSAARDSIVAGAGINAILNEWLSAELSYNGEGSADTEIHSINGSVTARF